MTENKPPKYFENWYETLTGSFGERLGAYLLEGIIMLPATLAVFISIGLNPVYNYFLIPITQGITFLYFVYLPVKYGATPGKLILGLRILKLDGTSIGYRESFLKYLPMFIYSGLSALLVVYEVYRANPDEYLNLNWFEQQKYLQSFTQPINSVLVFLIMAYSFINLLVFLLKDGNRSISDYLANVVVVVKKRFLEEQV